MFRYYQATEFFSNTSATSLNFVNEVKAMNSQCKDTTLLGSFSENHDQPRFAYYTSDLVLARNIIVFTMLQDGIPISASPSPLFPSLQSCLLTCLFSLSRTRTALLWRRRSLRPRSSLDIQLRYLCPSVRTHQTNERDPLPRHRQIQRLPDMAYANRVF